VDDSLQGNEIYGCRFAHDKVFVAMVSSSSIVAPRKNVK
jgi:hypothetical protein